MFAVSALGGERCDSEGHLGAAEPPSYSSAPNAKIWGYKEVSVGKYFPHSFMPCVLRQ